MPLNPYKDEIIEFSTTYQFCKEFGVTPDVIRRWRDDDPHEFMCFRSFLSGMAGASKESGDIKTDGNNHNRRTRRP